MHGMKYYSALVHPCEQSVHNLHRILRCRKNTMIFLKYQFNSFVLKPPPCTLLIKGAEEPFHKFVPARVSI